MKGQCIRANAQIGAFFSLACVFIPHLFKSKEASSRKDRNDALAWSAGIIRFQDFHVNISKLTNKLEITP